MSDQPVTDPNLLAQLNGTASPSGETQVTDPAILAQLNSEAPGYKVPEAIQALAKGITYPGRMMRANAILMEQLMAHPTEPQRALDYSKTAAAPGFRPQGVAQHIASFASGFADPMNIAANAVLPGGGLLKSVASGALAGLGSNLLDQSSQGRIDPTEAGLSAAGGGILGGGVHSVGSAAKSFIDMAPTVFSKAGLMKPAIERFIANKDIMQNAPIGADLNAANLRGKSAAVTQGLDDLITGKKDVYDALSKMTGTTMTRDELLKSKPIPPEVIPAAMSGLNKYIKNSLQHSVDIAKSLGKYTPEQISELEKRMSVPAIKTVFRIRDSIGKWMDTPGISDMVKKGLSQTRTDVNQILENLPGGDLFRNADQHAAEINQVHEMLSENLNKDKPGKTLKWLTDTFSGKHPDATDNMMHLAAMEKLSGKPIVQDMYDAITKAHFSQPLAGNLIKRSLAGASPFLISALFRIAGVPFQASLPIAALTTSAAQSPQMVGGMIRTAQRAEPYMQTAGKGLAVSGLNALRQLMGQYQQSQQTSP